MQTTQTPQRDELVKRVADLVPLLRRNADWSERNRRLADETVEAMTDAGIFRMRMPARYGGYETSAATMVDVGIQLGLGDGAAAFNVAAWWVTTWNAGLFPDEAQDEVFADPDSRIAGTLVVNGTAVPKDGGVVVNGEWAFNSGAHHSQWKLLSTLLVRPDCEPEPIMAIVPMSEMRIVDDWEVSALIGTGSVTTVAEDVFIPTVRTMPLARFSVQDYASKLNAELPMFRVPVVGAVGATTAGKMVGMARAALEAYLGLITGRTITSSTYERQVDASVTHLQAAEASLKIDEAEYHARRVAAMVDQKGLTGEAWTLEERAYARVVAGRVPQLTSEAVDLLAGAVGASSLYTKEPIQRIQRNVRAVTMHALHRPSTNLELYGRVLCGLEPNTFFI